MHQRSEYTYTCVHKYLVLDGNFKNYAAELLSVVDILETALVSERHIIVAGRFHCILTSCRSQILPCPYYANHYTLNALASALLSGDPLYWYMRNA